MQCNYLLKFVVGFLFLVMSIPSELSAQRKAGDILFDDAIVHIIRIRLDQQVYWDSLTYYKKVSDATNKKLYIQAATVTIDGMPFYSAGLRFKGASSYLYQQGKKKSFKIKLDKFVKCQDYDGVTTFNLNNSFRDPTMMREKLYLDYLKKFGAHAPRASYAKVYINNEYWGLYLLTEDINKEYLVYNFGSGKGNLYKGEPSAYLTKLGREDAAYKEHYEKSNHKKEDDWRDLVNLINTIHGPDLTSLLYKTQLDPVLNTQSCMKAWALNNFLLNMDSYNMEFQHNYYLYNNPDNNRFEWISYDGNYAFGAWYEEGKDLEDIYSYDIYQTDEVGKSPLSHNMLSVSPIYKDEYKMIMKRIANSFSDGEIYWTIDRLYKLIKDAAHEDPNKMYTNEEFETNIKETIYDKNFNAYPTPGLREFLQKRRDNVLNQLNAIN